MAKNLRLGTSPDETHEVSPSSDNTEMINFIEKERAKPKYLGNFARRNL